MWCFELISDGFTVGMLLNIVVNDEWSSIGVTNFYTSQKEDSFTNRNESLIDMFPE